MRALALAVLLAAPAAAAPAFRPERAIVRTDAGDLVLAFYAGAPRHAEKLLKLMAAGAYDGAPLAKIDATRFAAFGSAPRAPKAVRLPVENGGEHRYGVVSMAHQGGDADAGETAFVILYADLAGMNGRFSSVGEVTGGREVLESLKRVPVDGADRPVRPIAIRSTSVVATESALARQTLRGPDLSSLGRPELLSRRGVLLGLGTLLLLVAGALLLLSPDLPKASVSVALLAGLAGFFCLFAVYAGEAAASAPLSVGLFAATVAVFRLMRRFES